VDPFVVRTVSFKVLSGLVTLRHARRRLVTIGVTSNPAAAWLAGQEADAFPRDEGPCHLIRDRDGAFGSAYTHRIRAVGIRDHPTAPRSRTGCIITMSAAGFDQAQESRPEQSEST
jgi:hypothetical protein